MQTGDVGDALLNLVTAHALTGVDNQMSVSAELVTVCTTLLQDSANLPILARSSQFLRMFVHNYGQKRLDALILGLILPQLCTYTQVVCGKGQLSRGQHFTFQRFAADRGVFVPFSAQLPVDERGRPEIMVPGVLTTAVPRHTAAGFLRATGLRVADGRDVQRRALDVAVTDSKKLRQYLGA